MLQSNKGLTLFLHGQSCFSVTEQAGLAVKCPTEARILTVHRGLWLPESNPPFSFPSVVGFYVRTVDGTWPF